MIDHLGKECTACGACEAKCPVNAIFLKTKANGFTYPEIEYNKCINCNLCEKTCPIINHNNKDADTSIKSYAARAIEKPNLSSSGGSFFDLSKIILKKNGIVCGATMDKDLIVKHKIVTSIKDLYMLCGSKYIQSTISKEIYIELEKKIKEGILVLFVGTPCQVSALKNYLKNNYNNLFTIDLVCHGVPSPEIFSEYIKFSQDIRRKKIINFICRDNREGWDNNFKSTIIYNDGSEEYNSVLSNLWNRIFFSELITRPSCHSCKFSCLNRQGDITLGDFWGFKDYNDDSKEINTGISLILCNNEKGRKLIEKSNLKLVEKTTNKENHPNLYSPTAINPDSAVFLEDYSKYGFKYVVKKYFHFTRWLDFKIRVYNKINKLIRR